MSAMKRITSLFLLNALALSMLAASCNKPEPYTPPEPDDPKEDPAKPDDTPKGPQPGTYRFVASKLQGSWKAGDKIFVHGYMGTDSEIITLAAGDISADGKTATAKLDAVTGSLADPDGLYAAWPAEAVYPYKGILKIKTTFLDCSVPLTISYLEDDTFNFIDVSTRIKFSVNGDYNQFALASNDHSGINITRFEVEYSSETKTFNHKANDGYPFLYGTLEPGVPYTIWLPGDFNFNKGFTIYLGKDDVWSASYSKDWAVSLEAGLSLDLDDITAALTAYNGPAPKIPVMGDHQKITVKFNELSGLCLSENEDFLWGVGDDGSVAKLSFEGEVLYEKWTGGDLEAISRNPVTGDLIVGIEDEYNPAGTNIQVWDYSGIGRIPAPDFNKLEGLYEIPGISGYNNDGIEGVAFYKDGIVFAGAQHNSHLFCIDLNNKKVLWEKKMYDKQLVSEIADLCYDPLTGWLWIIDSERRMVFVFSGINEVSGNDMTLLGSYHVTGSNPESVCVDHKHSCIWVGDDAGSTSYIYRYDFTGLDDYIQ